MVKPWENRENMEKWLKTPVKEIVSQDNDLNGNLSKMLKLTVTSQDGRIFPLLVKYKILNGTTGDVYGKTDIFRNEVEIYDNTIHHIHDILKEVYPDDKEPIAPKCYYASEEFLILEDLTASGFEMGNRKSGQSLEQCLLVMRTLAKFHAASVILNERNPRALDKFQKHIFEDDIIQEPFGKFMLGLTTTLVEEVETWGEEWQEVVPWLKRLAGNFMPILKQLSTRKDSEFNVLIHGDVWTNNMLFRGGSAGIRFVDFQIAAFTSPVLDIAYFLNTSPNVDVIMKHMEKIIQEYYDTLKFILRALDYKKTIPSFLDIEYEVQHSLYGLFAIIAPYTVMQSDPELGFSFEESITTGKNPGPKMYNENFKKHVKFMLPLFYKNIL